MIRLDEITSPTDTLLNYIAHFGVSLDTTVVREALRLMMQGLMEVEVTNAIEAGHYERNGSRKNYRNGYRERGWRTSLGVITLHIPKLRSGSYYPAFLQAAEAEILDFVRRALVEGTDIYDIETLTHNLGLPTIDREQSLTLCQGLSALAERLHQRPFARPYQNVWLDVLKIDAHHVVLIALGITDKGEAVLLDFEVRHDADWQKFLAGLIRRSLRGVHTVMSDAHEGVREAVIARLPFASWRYSRTSYLTQLIEQLRADDDVVVAVSDLAINHEGRSAVREIWHIQEPLDYSMALAMAA